MLIRKSSFPPSYTHAAVISYSSRRGCFQDGGFATSSKVTIDEHFRRGFASFRLPAGRLLLWALVVFFCCETGCRGIRGESRQSIAARRLSRKGLEAMHAGQWEVAEGLFAGALDLTAADDRAHWGLAEALWQRGEQEAALRHMEEAVRLSASDPRLMRRLGRMYLDVGRLDDADQQSLAALEADRQSAEVWALRGDCLLHSGRQTEALAAYHRALAIQPDYSEVQLQIAEVYRRQERYDRLLATVDRLKDSPAGEDGVPTRAHLLRGIALQRLQRPGDAVRCFEEAIRSEPENAEAYEHLAALHLELGDVDAARGPLETAMRLAPHSPAANELARRIAGVTLRTASHAVPVAAER